ncbi:Putative non-heme bromoperoxidase BpoC [bacterium HR12]|nr:Putative non-heme bromoperoxidase BpoC [bacterium HR12]
MSRPRRAAVLTAGLAATALAGGVAARTIVRRHRRPDPEADEPLALLPPEDLGPVRSFDGTALAVRAAGPPGGPTLVFAHGFSLDLTTWHYQWTALADRYRCVLFDFRSHGRSEPAAGGDLSLAAMAHDLAAVLEAATPAGGPALVVGHSMGAMAALAMAEARPDLLGARVVGLLLAGATGRDLFRGAIGSVAGLLRPGLGTLRETLARLDRVRRHLVARPGDIGGLATRITQFGPDASPHLVDHVTRLAAAARSEVWTDGLLALVDLDLRHAAGHVRVPALVVVGERDRVTPPAQAVELVAALPEGRLAVIPGAGHLAMMEAHEAFNRRLEAFAAETLGERARRGRPAGARGRREGRGRR